MIKEDIQNFSGQFLYEPELANSDSSISRDGCVLAGMGGSHLAGEILKVYDPEINLIIHNNYGLPKLKNINNKLIILSSYSGDTEEVIDAFEEAQLRNLKTISISTGGKLLGLTKDSGRPYIVLPENKIQPRMALGFSFLAILRALGEEGKLDEVRKAMSDFNPSEHESKGKKIAEEIGGKIPVIYSSEKNKPLAYIWKVKFNETAKIPCFFNVFPELNHSEMAGFEMADYSSQFSPIILKSENDDPRILKRMEATQNLLVQKGMKVITQEIRGNSPIEEIFSSIIMADWASLYLAEKMGLNPEEVPVVEKFKKLIG